MLPPAIRSSMTIGILSLISPTTWVVRTEFEAFTAFVHQHKRQVQGLCEAAGDLGAPHIRRHDHGVPELGILEVGGQYLACGQRIDRDVKETLGGLGVDVDPDDAAGAQSLDHTRHEPGADRLAAHGHAFLAAVGEVWDHERDAVDRSSTKGIDVQQQFHQIVVDRHCTRLDQKDIVAAHQFADLDVDLAIGQKGRLALAQVLLENCSDFLSQGPISAAAEQTQWVFWHASTSCARDKPRGELRRRAIICYHPTAVNSIRR